jgi:hypothetical protein
MAWGSVESVMAKIGISPGTPLPVAIMVEVRNEDAVPEVRSELTRAGLEVASVDKKRWPFGRRWQVAAKGGPLPMTRTEIDRWLDSLEATLAKYDASVAGWVPFMPGA